VLVVLGTAEAAFDSLLPEEPSEDLPDEVSDLPEEPSDDEGELGASEEVVLFDSSLLPAGLAEE
jgi:hypothetical protein